MKKRGILRRAIAYVLTLCLMVTGLFVTDYSVVQAAETTTRVWYYNAENNSTIMAYVWNAADAGEALGTYPGAAMTQDGDSSWYYVDVPAAEGFNIKFSDGTDTELATTYISDGRVYVTATDTAYTGKEAAETALGLGGGSEGGESGGDGGEFGDTITVYFYNSGQWETVNAYAWGATPTAEALGGWPGTVTTASAVGDGWVEVEVPAEIGFHVIFFNAADDTQRADVYYTSTSSVYGNMLEMTYTTAEAAEGAMSATPTTLYFLNNGEWDSVYAYSYVDETAIAGAAYPGTQATAATDLGDGWWVVSVPQNASKLPFNVIFNNGSDETKTGVIEITNYENNYITGKGELFTSQNAAEASVGIVNETTVYFLNTEGWAEVGAYVYGTPGEALGAWPGAVAAAAPEKGDSWMKVSVPAKPIFSIIFFNTADDTQRAELQIPSESFVYVTSDGAVYNSVLTAELAAGIGDSNLATTVYFYNSRGWGDINAYVYIEGTDGSTSTLGAGWPGGAATKATEIGDNWWSFAVPYEASADTPFEIIFNDGVNQTDAMTVSDKTYVYANVLEKLYASAAEAEEAAANDTYDDGCESGENTDLNDYEVTFTEAGAVMPYITYEAEAANTNAEVLAKATAYRESIQSEASGRQAVKLGSTGDYVEFTLTEAANALVLRYNMPDSTDGAGINASLSLYVEGTEEMDLALTSKYAWVYGSYPYTNVPSQGLPHRYFDESRVMFDTTLPAGTTIKLQKDAGDTAENYIIDFIECELVGEPLTQPENSLSVTEYGAVANDGNDDHAAFVACIAAAAEADKEVWIPAGTFDLVEETPLEVNAVTLRGAGMWYTNLNGAGAAFKYQGTSKFYDFAMTGISAVRDDSGDLAGIEGNGSRATNVTIENIWMEHMKVGVWSCNTENLVIQGCRIRNTYADGINLCSGTNGAVVRNNSLRNTGDDCIAIWPWLGDCSDNTIAHNNVQVPTLANGIAIYGGGNNVVDANHVADTINNGAGITVGSEFSTAKGYTGTITVKNNVLDRCGSMQTDENYPIGAIWIWGSYVGPMTTTKNVYNNMLNDCVQEGILIETYSEVTNLNIQHNEINGATDGVYVYGNASGSAKVGNMTATGLTGDNIDNPNTNFAITLVDEDIVDDGGNDNGGDGDDGNDDGNDDGGNNGGDTTSTRIWFYNADNYSRVMAYTWNAPDEVLGGYPGTEATRDGDSNWYYVDVEYAEAFNVIFSDGTDANQASAYIQNGNVYVTATDTTFGSKEAAEEALGIGGDDGNDDGDDEVTNLFGDVKEADWFYQYVMFAYENNLMGGKGIMEDGTVKFDPSNTITRAEFVQILYSKEGKPDVEYAATFTDVPDGQWYTDAILWAAENEIVGGKKADFFDVSGKITRQEIAMILYKYALFKEYDVTAAADTDLTGFVDDETVAGWAETGMKWAVEYDVIGGKTADGGLALSPNGNAIRAEAATMMRAFMIAYEGVVTE